MIETAESQLQLTGIKVLDLSRILAGPLCAMMLGDMGADVLKVERASTGDDTRGWGPPFDEHGESAYYLSVNRNKLGLDADLGRPEDRRLLRSLMAEADVVIENFRPGVLERHGLGRAAMCEAAPRLVWCTLSGFGRDDRRPGYDFVVQAEAGWMAITGEPDGAPMKHGVALVDVLAGKDAAIAILGALLRRGRTGHGGAVAVSLERSAEAALVNVAQNAMVSGRPARRWGNAHANLVPYQLFQASDRGLVIAVGNDAQWLACARALELDLADEPALRSNAGRLAARERIVAVMRERMVTRSAAAWRDRLHRVGVPCGVVRTIDEVLAAAGGSPLTGMPPSVPGVIRRAPPRLGEHGDAVRARGWGAFR
jgi:crotonobetainyl-CoA:carnitine CoA-transferase CaiB-like acyl-CoA transferase